MNHRIPVSFFFINIRISRDGQFPPGLYCGLGAAVSLGIGDFECDNQTGMVSDTVFGEELY